MILDDLFEYRTGHSLPPDVVQLMDPDPTSVDGNPEAGRLAGGNVQFQEGGKRHRMSQHAAGIAARQAEDRRITHNKKIYAMMRDIANQDMRPEDKAAAINALQQQVIKEQGVSEDQQISELSPETVKRYQQQAQIDVKDLAKHASGEYGDIAKNIMRRRERGLSAAQQRSKQPVEEESLQGIDSSYDWQEYNNREGKLRNLLNQPRNYAAQNYTGTPTEGPEDSDGPDLEPFYTQMKRPVSAGARFSKNFGRDQTSEQAVTGTPNKPGVKQHKKSGLVHVKRMDEYIEEVYESVEPRGIVEAAKKDKIKQRNPVARAAQKVARGSGQHKNKRTYQRQPKHKNR